MSSTYNSIIIGRKDIAEDTLEISIKRPDGFSFQPGQYIQLGLEKLLYTDPKGRSRLMSIASSPLDQEKICLAFRNTGSGFKRTLQEMPLGAPVIIEGPHGFLALPEQPRSPIVFVAGGIGITPFMSMLRYASLKIPSRPITLLYANSKKSRAAYLSELQELSDQPNKINLKARFGIINAEFIRQNVTNLHECIWYVAGPPAMIASVRNFLFLLGVEDEKVYFEEFTGY